MREFELYKFYKHKGGRVLHICGVASTEFHGEVLVGEEVDGNITLIGRSEEDFIGWHEITKDEWDHSTWKDIKLRNSDNSVITLEAGKFYTANDGTFFISVHHQDSNVIRLLQNGFLTTMNLRYMDKVCFGKNVHEITKAEWDKECGDEDFKVKVDRKRNNSILDGRDFDWGKGR